MQMKNLLRLMGALALTTGAATSVVACGTQATVNLDSVLKKKELGTVVVADVAKPRKELKDAIKIENKNMNLDGITVEPIVSETGAIVSAKVIPDGKIYNGDPITVTFTLVAKKTDAEVTADIKTALEKGVDGSSLNDRQTQSDAKDVITAAIKVVTDADQAAEATFTFDKGDTALTKGENNINIKVTLGNSKNVTVAVKLTDIAVHGEIKNPIVNIQPKIDKILHNSYKKFYESLTDTEKGLFDVAAKAKGMSGYELYLFFLANGEIPTPSVHQV